MLVVRLDFFGVVYIGEVGFGIDYEVLIEWYFGVDMVDSLVDYNDFCWLFFMLGLIGRLKVVVFLYG